jgi:hypothetical protein
MEYLFIDESGSLTKDFASIHPNFIMYVVRVKDIVNLRKLLKRFILNHYDELKKTDENNKMFDRENFLEIKGSALNSKLKNELARYLCQGKVLEIYYIHVLNQEVKHYFYEDTSRVFNYVFGLILKKELENKKAAPRGRQRIKMDVLKSHEIFKLFTKEKISEAEALQRLGVSRATFYRRLKEFRDLA